MFGFDLGSTEFGCQLSLVGIVKDPEDAAASELRKSELWLAGLAKGAQVVFVTSR